MSYKTSIKPVDDSIISAEGCMLLEVFAMQTHTFICIFDAIRSCCIFRTQNALSSALNEDIKGRYPGFIHDKRNRSRIIDLEAHIVDRFTHEEKRDVRIFVCGGCHEEADQSTIKHLLQRMPLSYGPKVFPGIYLDNIRNVTHLVSGDGYWIRITNGKKVYSWFSDQEKVLKHDIISEREKEVITSWANGNSLSKIGDSLFISVNTVKNHLKSCRNRLLARDNASLVQLCLLSDAIQ